MDHPTVYLKPGKERIAQSRHPWIFDGAIDTARTTAADPSAVQVRDADGRLIGVGTYNPSSPIAVRLFAREERPLDEGFFVERFGRAAALREVVVGGDTDALRVLNGEGDCVPGLVADSFAGHLVLQVGTPGVDRLQGAWLPALEQVFRPRSILLKPNQAAANQERMSAPTGQLMGATPDEIEVHEHGLRLLVEPRRGQKTGFFCDQRDNRRLVAGLAGGSRVLDCYSYTGAFAAHALAGGAAAVTCVESSGPARELLARNLASAGGGGERRIVAADAVEFLRSCEERFDVAVVDPPALAKRRHHLDRASKLYRELFSSAMGLLAGGGLLLACSCSAAVDRQSFEQILVTAARASGREARILHRRGAAPDHPVSAFHPEGDYLKATLMQVD